MTTSRDYVARFSRLAGGKQSRHDVDDTLVSIMLEPNAVAFNLQNSSQSSSSMAVRTDAGNPVTEGGWELAAGETLGWIDCVGALVVKVTAAGSDSVLWVWQILDQDGP